MTLKQNWPRRNRKVDWSGQVMILAIISMFFLCFGQASFASGPKDSKPSFKNRPMSPVVKSSKFGLGVKLALGLGATGVALAGGLGICWYKGFPEFVFGQRTSSETLVLGPQNPPRLGVIGAGVTMTKESVLENFSKLDDLIKGLFSPRLHSFVVGMDVDFLCEIFGKDLSQEEIANAKNEPICKDLVYKIIQIRTRLNSFIKEKEHEKSFVIDLFSRLGLENVYGKNLAADAIIDKLICIKEEELRLKTLEFLFISQKCLGGTISMSVIASLKQLQLIGIFLDRETRKNLIKFFRCRLASIRSPGQINGFDVLKADFRAKIRAIAA